MALKHLQVSVWAILVVAAVGALAQDSDGDNVANNAPDHCPDTPGVASNYGCPADLEVVVVHGWYDNSGGPFEWVTNYAICPDGTLHNSYDECSDYGTWGEFATAYYDSAGHIATFTEDDGHRPQEEEEDCQGTACWTPGDWVAWCSQVSASDQAWIVDITPECQHLGYPTYDEFYAALLQVAAEHPGKTCIIAGFGGAVATAVVARFSKNPSTGMWTAVAAAAGASACAWWALDASG